MRKIDLPNNAELDVENGLVIIGANGSGKTRFGSWIDITSPQNGIVHRISAQKSLNMPDNIRPMNIDNSIAALLCGHEGALIGQYAQYKSGNKWGGQPETYLINDYERLLIYLFSEHNEISNKYLDDSRKSKRKVQLPKSKIMDVKEIWEEIMPHRQLVIRGGHIDVCAIGEGYSPYKASQMSDGERVAFYLIGQALAVPSDGILVIDEPELHLHKSIQYPLWDRIEKARSDCLFVYLTHDVEFAASRIGFKKLWLTDYDGTKWNWKELAEEMELPEELLLEVYGSRKKILLVEGHASSHDVKLYKNIFSDFLVRPCGSCENVIIYTKALRANNGFHQLNVYGLIDKDRRTDEMIDGLAENGIFTLKVAEVENLFAVPEVLAIVANYLDFDYEEKLTAVKQFVIKELEKEIDFQAAERATQEIKEILSKADLGSKCGGDLTTNYNKLMNNIDPQVLFNEIKKTFQDIVNNADYEKLLSFYNRKSIASRIGVIFDLKEQALPALITRISQNEAYTDKLQKAISRYLPDRFTKLMVKKAK